MNTKSLKWKLLGSYVVVALLSAAVASGGTLGPVAYAGPALGIMLGMLYALRLTRKIANCAAFAEAAANGRAAGGLDVTGSDETGRLAESLRSMDRAITRKDAFLAGLMNGVAVPFSVITPQDVVLYTNRNMMDLMEIEGRPEDQIGKQSGEYMLGVKRRDTLSSVALRDRQVKVADRSVETRRG